MKHSNQTFPTNNPICSATRYAEWKSIDFRRHHFRSHGVKDVMDNVKYMREGLPLFQSLHNFPSCWFWHYDKAVVVEQHPSTCGTADIAWLCSTTSGASEGTSQNSNQQRKNSSSALLVEPQTKLISVLRHGLVKVEPRPGEMVGVGARRKTPNRQMRPVASSDSLSDASTNPLLKLLVFCSKTQHKRRSSATGDRNAQRLADNTAAAC